MFVFEIKLDIKYTNENDYIVGCFWSFISSLLHNGQILNSVDIVAKNDNNKLLVSVICPELNSLSSVFYDKYLIESVNKIQKISKSKIKFKLIGKDAESDKNSNIECCNKTEFYILFTHSFDIYSPIRCGNCFCSIPLYKIYKSTDNGVRRWQKDYIRFDDLQLNCDLHEKFALNEMSKITSDLSQSGLEICKNLEKIMNKPAFYYLFYYSKNNYKKDINRKCPSCNDDWLLEEPLNDFFRFKCDKCRIVSSLSVY